MCGASESRPSWIGSTVFDETEFRYFDCMHCGSAFIQPTPSQRTLEIMYSSDFLGDSPGSRPVEGDDTSAPAVVEEMTRLAPGTFVDYGCGDGRLMIAASSIGWRSIGVEFAEDIAQEARRRSGHRVVTLAEVDDLVGQVDVLHLGDVVEHMSDPVRELKIAMRLLRPGGVFMAQGPLEANASFFTWCMRTARNLRGRPPNRNTPYHLVLATSRGQRELFRRVGLTGRTWEVREVAWPAPSSVKEVRNARGVLLFAVRRVSRAITTVGPNDWGNRYWYVGRVAD
jgi:SAM-dependent methyltransferase